MRVHDRYRCYAWFRTGREYWWHVGGLVALGVLLGVVGLLALEAAFA